MFSQETVDLHDDGFDGSNDELRISQEVFYGNVAGFCSKGLAASGATKNVSEGTTMVETSICSHSENSAVTNQASSKNVCKEDTDAVEFQRDSGTKSFIEGCISGARIDHNVHAKRMRLSMNELSKFKPYLNSSVASSAPVKKVVSGMYHPTARQVLMCHVVESCGEGMTSSCYLLRQYPELDQEGNLGNGNAPNGSLSGSDGSELKQVDVCKSVASPISQESSVTKLLVSRSSAPSVGESGVLHCAKRRLKRDSSPEPEDDVLLTSDSMKNSRALLRSRVFHLLKRAGWSTETRKRGNGRFRYMYRSPEGKLFREFRKVWNLCGQSLSAHGNYQMAGEDKQWTDFGQFWSDLYDTLRYIEDKMDDWEPRYALSCQWSLLNPFVILVLVDRKIHALKAGNLVKVDQSNAVDVGSIHEVKCKFKPMVGDRKRSVGRHDGKIIYDSSLVSDTVVINGDGRSKQGMETHKSRSIYVSEGNSLRLVKTIDNFEGQSLGTYTDKNMHNYSSQLPTSVSDSTCLQYSSCLYDVPVGIAEVNMIFGQTETLSPHQDSCMSSPSCYKRTLDPFKENAKDNAGCLLEAENVGSSNKLSTSLFEHLSGSQMSRFNKFLHNRYNNSFNLKEVNYSNDTNEASLFVQSDSIESQSWRKGMRPKKHDSSKRRSKACQLKDDDLLISAIIKKRNSKSRTNQYNAETGMFKLKPLKKRKSQKGSCKLLPRSLGKGGKHFTERWSLTSERTVLSWLISAGAVLINEVFQYRDKDDAVVKDGLITRDGILCKCCNEVFSVSGFKFHSGFKQNRPCLNLFVGSGRPYTLCQLQAWSAEYRARRSSNRSVPVDEFDKNDDSCGLCGDGGELLCCDNCPSTFHQSCLSAKELPEGSWYCLNCTCWLCEDLVNDKEKSSSNVALKCSQCERKYHQGCLIDKGMAGVGGSPWFCGICCEEVYDGLQSRIGLSSQIADGYSWTLLRCIHDDQKVPSPQRFALKAECNSKLAVAVTIMEECFLSMIDPRTGIDMIPQVVYNWGSEFARLDYHGFYTAVLEKNDVLVSVASIRVHGVAVAEMPLIATCSKYRRQGMCRHLLNSIEKMLISVKVEKLVITAIADLVETWTIGFGFIPVEEDEKRSMRKINLMVFPGTVMLKKTLYVNQDTPLSEGAQDISPMEMEPKMCGNTEETSPEANAGHLKGKLTALPDIEAGDTGKDSEAADVMESEPLNSSGLSKIEADDCQVLQISAIGQGIKLDNDQNQLAIEDQYNSLQVPKVEELIEGRPDVSPMETEPKMSGYTEETSPEANADQLKGKLTTLPDTEAGDTQKDSEAAAVMEFEPLNSSGFSKIEVDDCQGLRISTIGQGIKLDNDQNQHVTEDQYNSLQVPKFEELIEGKPDVSPMEEPKMRGKYTEETSPEENADQLKGKLTTLPDTEAGDTWKDSEAAAVMESVPLNSSGFSKIEADDCQGLQISAIGQGIELDNDQNQHAIEDQYNSLQVPKVEELNEVKPDISPMDKYPEMCGNTEETSLEANADQLKGKLTTLPDTEAGDTQKDSEASAVMESEPLNSSGFSKSEADDCQSMQISAKGQRIKLDNDQYQHAIEDQNNSLLVLKVEELIGEILERQRCMEIGAEPGNQLELQGYAGCMLSLQKSSSDECLDHDVPILTKEEVSGSETKCVNDDENQLSLIEQSQEASVLPRS